MINMTSIKKHYKMRLDDIKDTEIVKGQVVLLGDCVFDNIRLEQHFQNEHFYNNGICGDTTVLLKESLYKRAIKFKPSVLFLSIGSNDIGFDKRDVKETYENIVDIIEEVKRRSRETKIVVMSVLPVNPVNKEFINRDLVDERNNFDINMLNYYIQNYTSRNRITFLNLNPHLANNFDQLHLDYTSDGFHLNEQGYKVLSDVILKYV